MLPWRTQSGAEREISVSLMLYTHVTSHINLMIATNVVAAAAVVSYSYAQMA